MQISTIQKVKKNTQLYIKAIFSCKEKGLSRDELAKMIGTSGPIVSHHKREEIKPSIDVVSKIADILGVSLDYLTGFTDLELDHSTVKRIEDISKMKDQDRSFILKTIDALVRDFKAQKAYAS